MGRLPRADSNFGLVLPGDFRIGQLIGEGGMGLVYEGVHETSNTRVAIKLMRTDGASKERADREKRFRREARLTAQFNHESVIRQIASGEILLSEQQVPYMVLELLEGRDLDQHLQFLEDAHLGPAAEQLEGAERALQVAQARRLPWEQARKIVAQILRGLAHVHDLGIVHRDLKPHNMHCDCRIDGRYLVKITDFGIASMETGIPQGDGTRRVGTKLTKHGQFIGSPEYTSPEQAAGKPAVPQSDLYSIGAILFELLTGRLLFDEKSTLALLTAHRDDAPPRLAKCGVTFPEREAVQRLLDKLLEKNPEKRHRSAREALEHLESIAATAGPSSARRRRVLRRLLIATSILLIIVFSSQRFLRSEARSAEKEVREPAPAPAPVRPPPVEPEDPTPLRYDPAPVEPSPPDDTSHEPSPRELTPRVEHVDVPPKHRPIKEESSRGRRIGRTPFWVRAQGTLYDQRTNLTWQRTPSSELYTQTQANRYCWTLALAGGSWRLPTQRELLSIAMPHGPPFPDARDEKLWSSSLSGPYGTYVSFYYGDAYREDGNKAHRVRCVR